MKISLKMFCFMLFASLVLTGCPPQTKKGDNMAGGGTGKESQVGTTHDDIITDTDNMSASLGLDDVYFAYNSSTLSSSARSTLRSNVEKIKANPKLRITIAGHCDERGSSEYNLGLGEDRAKAVKSYLIGQGVSSGSITTTSYGEEQPQCYESNNECWQKNRRAQFLVK